MENETLLDRATLADNVAILSKIEKYDPIGLPVRFADTIAKAVEILLGKNIPNLHALLLFGSTSKGCAKSGSDVDICIVTDEPIKDRVKKVCLSESVEDLQCEVDLAFVSISTLDSTDTFTSELRKYSKLLWRREDE